MSTLVDNLMANVWEKDHSLSSNVPGSNPYINQSTSPSAFSGSPSSGSGGSSSSSSSSKSSSSNNAVDEAKKIAADQRNAFLKELDSTYSGTMNRIGEMRSELKSSKPQLEASLTAPYTSQVPMVEQAGQEGEDRLNALSGKTQMSGQNALADARSLYNELTGRNRQLFGSGEGSSVGQASSELLGREQMKQTGDIRQSVQTAVQDFALKIQNIRTETQAKLQSLEEKRQGALAQAQLVYQDKLSQLNQLETETRNSKSQEKLAALRDYYNDIRSTNAQVMQYQNQINAMREQAELETSSMYSGLTDYIGGAENDANAGYSQMSSQVAMAPQNIANSMAIGSDPTAMSSSYGSYSGGYKPLSETDDELYSSSMLA